MTALNPGTSLNPGTFCFLRATMDIKNQIVSAVEKDEVEQLSRLATEHPAQLEALWNEQLAATAAHHGSLRVLMWMHQQHLVLSENVAAQAARAGQVDVLVWFVKNRVGPWNPFQVLSILAEIEYRPQENLAKMRSFCQSVLGTESATWNKDRMTLYTGELYRSK